MSRVSRRKFLEVLDAGSVVTPERVLA